MFIVARVDTCIMLWADRNRNGATNEQARMVILAEAPLVNGTGFPPLFRAFPLFRHISLIHPFCMRNSFVFRACISPSFLFFFHPELPYMDIIIFRSWKCLFMNTGDLVKLWVSFLTWQNCFIFSEVLSQSCDWLRSASPWRCRWSSIH